MGRTKVEAQSLVNTFRQEPSAHRSTVCVAELSGADVARHDTDGSPVAQKSSSLPASWKK